jgi:hypothetical protein
MNIDLRKSYDFYMKVFDMKFNEKYKEQKQSLLILWTRIALQQQMHSAISAHQGQ